MATLPAYICRAKHDIDNRSSALTTTWGLLHRPNMLWTLVHKRLQTRAPFLPTLCKFRIPLHCQASQTEISKRTSTTLCQTVNGRPRKQCAVEQLGSSLPKKLGAKNGEYLVNETWHRQLGNGVGKYEGSPTLSQNFMNFGPQTA